MTWVACGALLLGIDLPASGLAAEPAQGSNPLLRDVFTADPAPLVVGEGSIKPFTAQDIRFTTKDGVLYAITLGHAAGKVTIAALAKGGASVSHVEVVGTNMALKFTLAADGLHIDIPEGASHAFGIALKIEGRGLV